MEVSLNEELKGLKSAEFKNDKGITNITGNEIALKGEDGKANIATLNEKGLTVGDEQGANGSDKTHTVYGKNGVTVYGKDGQSAVSLTTKNENGKDTATATLAFAKNENSGTGVITGLADLTDSSDASSAANKKYVDDKVQSINGNRPFDYYVDGKKVVKGQDGNFHKEGKPDEKLSADEVKKVVIKAEPTATPIGISNVASGLGLEAQTEEAKKKVQEKATELTKAVEEKVKAVGES